MSMLSSNMPKLEPPKRGRPKASYRAFRRNAARAAVRQGGMTFRAVWPLFKLGGR